MRKMISGVVAMHDVMSSLSTMQFLSFNLILFFSNYSFVNIWSSYN